jgi:hypothetical protein
MPLPVATEFEPHPRLVFKDSINVSYPQQPPSTGDMGDVKNGPLAKAGQSLIGVYLDYQEYVQAGGSGPFSSKRAANVLIDGTNVGVDIRGADLNDLVTTLSHLGMQIEITDANTSTVEGFLPISRLPAVVQLTKVYAISPIYKPSHRQSMP